jgi:hypothetical protein
MSLKLLLPLQSQLSSYFCIFVITKINFSQMKVKKMQILKFFKLLSEVEVIGRSII